MSRSSRRSSLSSVVSVKLRNRRPQFSVKCPKHTGQDIEIFCSAHDMVYCSTCATDHRSCEAVVPVTEVPQEKIDALDSLEIDQKTNTIYRSLETIQDKNHEHIRFLREQEKEIIKEIEVISNTLIHHINYLRDAAVASLHNKCKEFENNIERDIAQISKITDHIQRYQGKTPKQDRQRENGKYFIQQKLKQHICAEAECHLDLINSCDRKTIEFSQNQELYEYVLSARNVGLIKEEVLTMVPEIESVEKVKIKGKRDKNNCGISGICQLPDGTVLLCDNDNDKLKRLNKEYKVRDECDLAVCPSGVCCTGEHEVAVKMYNNKIYFVSVKESLTVTRSIQTHSGNVIGIEYCFDKLWVSEMNAIQIYSKSGELERKILNNADNNNTVKSRPHEIAFGIDKTIYVADFSDRVLCLNEQGDVRSVLKDGRLRKCQGLCVSNDNIVFVAGYDSGNIVMFGKDGKRLGEIHAAVLGLKQPCSLSYDNINNALLIGCWEGNKITVVRFHV